VTIQAQLYRDALDLAAMRRSALLVIEIFGKSGAGYRVPDTQRRFFRDLST